MDLPQSSSTHAKLRTFLLSQMQMSHVYQPVMLEALLASTLKPTAESETLSFSTWRTWPLACVPWE